MKLVIYTTKMSERAAFEKEFQTVIPVFTVNDGLKLGEGIRWFHECENGVLIVPIAAAATGWNAPDETIILFSESVKDDAYKLQAAARVHRSRGDRL